MMISNRVIDTTFNAQRDLGRYAWRHYTGEYAYPDFIREYLHKQWQRESDDMFKERMKWADPSMHLSTVVDELVGMVFQNEDEATREWIGEARNNLGDPTLGGSPSYSLITDVDGEQTNWLTFWKEVAIEMTVLRRTWVLVDGVKMEGGVKYGEATLHHVKPWNVLDTVYDKYGHLTEAVIMTATNPTALGGKSESEVLHLTLDGWAKYERYSSGKFKGLKETGEYEFYADKSKRRKILPLYPCDLPLERNVGYSLARKVNSIFNMESVRDYAVRNITFNFLRIVGNDEEFGAKIEQLKAGTNVLQQNPTYSAQDEFIGMDSSMVNVTSEVLQGKIESFYKSAFKEYNDAAGVKTATEIIQKSASSLNAFLNLLSGALDEAENMAMMRLTQIYNPDNQEVWADTYVHRSTDFVPADIEVTINNLVTRYLGQGAIVPTTPEMKAQILTQVYKMDNIVADEQAINQLSQTDETESV